MAGFLRVKSSFMAAPGTSHQNEPLCGSTGTVARRPRVEDWAAC